MVAKKNLFNGGMLESEVSEAEAVVGSALAEVEATYRQECMIESARQSMNQWTRPLHWREIMRVTTDEIAYLRSNKNIRQRAFGRGTLV